MGAANQYIRSHVIEACIQVEEDILDQRSFFREEAVRQAMKPYKRFSWKGLTRVTIYPTREEALDGLANMSAFADIDLFILWDNATFHRQKQLFTVYQIKQAAEKSVQDTYFWMTTEEFDCITKYYKERQ